LKALEDQLSFGTDKRVVKRLLNGIAAARKGECVAYAPEYFRDRGYIVVDKIRADRRTEHKGHNIDVQAANYTDIPEIGPPSSLSEIKSLEELRGFEAPAQISEIPTTMTAETPKIKSSFYPPSDINADVIKEKPQYSWEANTKPKSPRVEYDMKPDIEKKSGGRGNPLLAIGGTIGFAAFAYSLIRNL
jgi:hypothetical protein